ncbi:MAG: patatin-like phospholipase family protein [Alphaproteobacteria bacterium]|nr:patatin-like phospholipase family protein [Alphaproteobacteria bacterium]
MLMRTSPSRDPVNAVGYFTGGGRYGYLSIRFAQAIEEESGRKLAELFQGGFIGSSVGSIAASTASFELMSMRHLSRRFIKELPHFMPHDPWFHGKQALVDIQNIFRETFIKVAHIDKVSDKLLDYGINSGPSALAYQFLRSGMECKKYSTKESVASLYNREYMENVIQKWFESVTLSDAPNPLFLTSQKTGPDCREPYDFYFVDPAQIKPGTELAKHNPTLNVSVSDAILAATAMPTAFQAHHILETGTSHTDQAQVDTGTVQLMALQNSLKNGFGMGLVQFDTFLGNHPILAHHHNGKGWLKMIADQDLTNNHTIQTQLNAQKLHSMMLGVENHHVLKFSPEDMKSAPFNDDILDTTPREIQNMIDGMNEYLHKNKDRVILPVVDFLVENAYAHEVHNQGWLGSVANLLPFSLDKNESHEQQKTTPPLLPLEEDELLPEFSNKHL